MKLTFIGILLFLTSFLFSCSKKIELKNNDIYKSEILISESGNTLKDTEETEQIEQLEKIEQTIKEELVIDTERTFLIDDWHPLKQTEYIKKIKEELKEIKNKDIDENLYNDIYTLEFTLVDNRNQTYTLYHNIRNINNFSLDDYEIYKYWGIDSVWCFKEEEGFSIMWNNINGAILILGTDDTGYSTKRGVRVGGSIEDVMTAYSKDSKVYEYDYEQKKYELTIDHVSPCFVIMKSNECISINYGNPIEEEMMTLSFLLEEGVINKIIIKTGN